MDGITLYAIRSEIAGYLPLKVQKVQQPRPKEVVFSLWSTALRDRLVLSLESNRPYFGFSNERKENPPIPPGFCLGLRKRLEGGKLTGIRQHRMDRVLYLDFEGHDDFGNPSPFVLVFDLAGHGQNIGLCRDGVLEAAAIPPVGDRFAHGREYVPPAGERLDLSSVPTEDDLRIALLEARSRREDARAVLPLDEKRASPEGAGALTAYGALNASIEGIGKDLATSVLLTAGVDSDKPIDEDGARAIATSLVEVSARLVTRTYYPAIYRGSKGQPLFHVLPLRQYEVAETFPTVLDGVRALRTLEIVLAGESSLRGYAEALYRKVFKKVESRFQAQTEDYARSRDYMKYKSWAQLLDSSGARTPAGYSEISCLDYYKDPPEEVVVPLNPKHSARDNAKTYWNKYAKMNRAQKVLEESVAKTTAELQRIAQARQLLETSSVAERSDGLERAASLLEALARKNGIPFKRPHDAEQMTEAHLRATRPQLGAAATQLSERERSGSPESFPKPGTPKLEVVESVNGAFYLIGGNARQNDYLVTKIRRPGDIWFHVKNAKGAHVLLRPSQDGLPTEEDIVTGARLAAERSEARAASKVEVDYVDAARIRKPRGGAPGFVTYTGQKTILVSLR